MKKCTAVLVVLAILYAVCVAQAATLNIGDKPPALKVSKWVKGRPVSEFENDKVYVVEFWATWCGPCIQSIPHLTELAKEYKDKVTFIGVNIWDTRNDKTQANYEKRIADFVKEKADKMAYKVALDDLKGTMADTWMKASGSNGIPTSFVIGKDGRIAMITHPMSLDKYLEDILSGQFDMKTEAEKHKARIAEEEKFNNLFAKAFELAKKEQNKEAVAEIDRVLSTNPEYESRVVQYRFRFLLKSDESAAADYALKLSEGMYKEDTGYLAGMAESLLGCKNPDYDKVEALAQKSIDVLGPHGSNPYALSALAEAKFGKGEIDKAIEYQTKAIDILQTNPNLSEKTRKWAEDRLNKYKAASEKKADTPEQ
ncbi:redoxin family protein [bacterium]|nr:redoxin family protein [bacterium]